MQVVFRKGESRFDPCQVQNEKMHDRLPFAPGENHAGRFQVFLTAANKPSEEG